MHKPEYGLFYPFLDCKVENLIHIKFTNWPLNDSINFLLGLQGKFEVPELVFDIQKIISIESAYYLSMSRSMCDNYDLLIQK